MLNKRQNLAKFLYDIAKLIFGGFVVPPFWQKDQRHF
jgi:hypothetical protein